ncbi:MAG TPA: lysophospholipid acyltransferase family protein [Steroidobacteraceae bacterium]|nr:lysophospholipid acyltransferase family protein [Steroidobacteraceae bacterium]
MASVARPSLGLRLASWIPLFLWYPFARLLAFLCWRVIPYRRRVVEENLRACFPELDDARRERVIRDYYRGFADMLVEIFHVPRMSRAEVDRRVPISNPELVRDEVARGRPVLIMAAHQCNWEWMLLAFSTQLGVQVDAAYKPLSGWGERAMLAVRSRFGARMIPAQQLLGDLIQQRHAPRAIAMLADQEPVKSDRRHWVTFLNRDTAFFLGAEEIARTMRYAAVFARLKRVGRGRYACEFVPLAAAGEKLEPGEFTARYAALAEEQIRQSPPDWPWSHKRWKLKKPLYGA